MQYAHDYDERTVDNDYGTYHVNSICWIDLLQPYTKSYQVFSCPSATQAADNLYANPNRPKYSYAANQVYSGEADKRLFPSFLPDMEDASSTVFAGDSQRYTTVGNVNDVCGWQVIDDTVYTDTAYPSLGSGSQGRYDMRHFEGANFVFFDGHTKWMKLGQILQKNNAGTHLKIFTRQFD